jgi:hypothetical protein
MSLEVTRPNTLANMSTMEEQASPPKRRRSRAFALGARSALDLAGTGLLSSSLFPLPRWETVDAEAAIAGDLARVMSRFGMSAQCGGEALANGEDINRLPPGCTDGVVPRRLPLRHVTATHSTIRR